MIMRVRFLFGLAWTWIVAAFADAQTPQVGSGEPFFGREVLPILQANCFKCHGDQGVKGRLSLFSRAAMLKGGASGPAILLERPDESRLLKAINHQDDLAMPPGGKLTQKEITILTRWVKDGAPWPDHIVAKMPATERGLKITQEDRAYWAYQPVKRPAVPAVKEKAWVRNPIDAFILAKLEGKDLAAASPADRLALARRLYYDVIGLPPTPDRRQGRRRLRAPDRQVARSPAVWRKVGPALARYRALRRDQRLRIRSAQAVRLALSRLRH
jgi:mono/diheme cytochrome c family protein